MKIYQNGLVVSEQICDFLSSFSSHITSQFMRQIDRETEWCNFLDVEDQRITYIDTKKYPDINKDNAFSEENKNKRIQTSPSRIFGKIFNKSAMNRHFSGNDLEFFANAFKSYFGPPLTLVVVKGEDVRKYYNQEHYTDGLGSLNKSCMRYDECQKYLDIYVDHSEMLVGFDQDNKVAARAILWPQVGMIEGNNVTKIKLMDRIYTSRDKDVFQFRDWAKENNYAFKYHQTHSDKELICFADDKPTMRHLFISIPNLTDYKFYPYLDTFSYGYADTNILTNRFYKHISKEPVSIGVTYYRGMNEYINTNGSYSRNTHERWETPSPNTPPRIFNEDYNGYLSWVNSTFGFSFDFIDVKSHKSKIEQAKLICGNIFDNIPEFTQEIPEPIESEEIRSTSLYDQYRAIGGGVYGAFSGNPVIVPVQFVREDIGRRNPPVSSVDEEDIIAYNG
ncbi:hypothetical protein EBU94_04815 [bacterium]|nr:hypothetical protein [bacterium]